MSKKDWRFFEESWNEDYYDVFKTNRERKKVKYLKKVRREKDKDDKSNSKKR
jgi:hypothetical protein